VRALPYAPSIEDSAGTKSIKVRQVNDSCACWTLLLYSKFGPTVGAVLTALPLAVSQDGELGRFFRDSAK
jgi:hypothetical protein